MSFANDYMVMSADSTKTMSTTQVSFYSFLLLTFILIGRPQEVFPVLQSLRPALAFTLINVILVNPLKAMFEQSLSKKYLAFYVIMLLGIPFALYRRAAFEFAIFQYIVNMIYFGLLITHVDSYKRARDLVFILVSSICFFGVASLVLGTMSEERFTFGSTYDPNDLAYLFVSLIPFTVLFFSENEKLPVKVFAAATGIISLLVILLTGSRGGLISLATILMLFLFTRMIPVKRSIKVMVLIGIIIFAVANKDKIFTERYSSILSLELDYNVTDELGRLQLWKKGIEFTLTRPLLGVGAQCFPTAIGMERRHRHVIERWQVVHNSYLQISSELGLIAFIIFILMIKETLHVYRRARHRESDQIKINNIQRLAGVTEISFISHCIAAFFLTQGYSILFTSFFALAASYSNLIEGIIILPTSKSNIG